MNEVIGLVGYPGAGKTFVANLMKQHMGYGVIYADNVGHMILDSDSKVREDILREFGKDVFEENGSVNKKILANIVFNNHDSLSKLNAIVHPAIIENIKKITNYGGKQVIDAALLFEMGLDEICDEVWFVDVSFVVRLGRVQDRGWSGKQLISREIHFLSEEELTERSDRTLSNIGSAEVMLQTIKEFLGQ